MWYSRFIKNSQKKSNEEIKKTGMPPYMIDKMGLNKNPIDIYEIGDDLDEINPLYDMRGALIYQPHPFDEKFNNPKHPYIALKNPYKPSSLIHEMSHNYQLDESFQQKNKENIIKIEDLEKIDEEFDKITFNKKEINERIFQLLYFLDYEEIDADFGSVLLYIYNNPNINIINLINKYDKKLKSGKEIFKVYHNYSKIFLFQEIKKYNSLNEALKNKNAIVKKVLDLLKLRIAPNILYHMKEYLLAPDSLLDAMVNLLFKDKELEEKFFDQYRKIKNKNEKLDFSEDIYNKDFYNRETLDSIYNFEGERRLRDIPQE